MNSGADSDKGLFLGRIWFPALLAVFSLQLVQLGAKGPTLFPFILSVTERSILNYDYL